MLEGMAAIDGTGNELDNRIYGNDNDNVLIGLDGNDDLWGKSGADRLVGGAGNDWLDGGGGADILEGGPGDDGYRIDAEDQVIELPGEGIDLIYSSQSYTLGQEVERLMLEGMAAIDGTGNELDNRIYGNDNDNVLSGLVGNDSLYGKAGNDILMGGGGDDSLNGDDGDDEYRFAAGHGQDVIWEAKNPGSDDRIVYEGALDRYDLWFHRQGSLLVITWLGTNDQVYVGNWSDDPVAYVARILTPDGELHGENIQAILDAMAPYGAPVNGMVNLTAEQRQSLDAVIDAAWN